MLKKHSFLAVIPARGNSKRLPSKNLLPLLGKPLIVWAIEAAQRSRYIDFAMLSTDSREIMEACRGTGIDIPFQRPEELATDHASSFDVVRHALFFLETQRRAVFEFVILLQPTSPLRSAEDIDAAIESLIEKRADAVVSVCEVDHPPVWSGTLPSDLSLADFIPPRYRGLRAQDLPSYYRLNGAIYICRAAKLLEEGDFFLKSNIFASIMPKERSIDIDTRFDFDLAEFMLQKRTTP